jgi:hypothetical protein
MNNDNAGSERPTFDVEQACRDAAALSDDQLNDLAEAVDHHRNFPPKLIDILERCDPALATELKQTNTAVDRFRESLSNEVDRRKTVEAGAAAQE